MDEAKAAAVFAPQNVSVNQGGYVNYGSSLVVKYTAGADVQKAADDGKNVTAQIDWKLTGPGITDSQYVKTPIRMKDWGYMFTSLIQGILFR